MFKTDVHVGSAEEHLPDKRTVTDSIMIPGIDFWMLSAQFGLSF